jgi:glutaconate CoA-transferase subunit B
MGSRQRQRGGDVSPVEYMITGDCRHMLDGLGHVAVGARSPSSRRVPHIHGALGRAAARVSILGSRRARFLHRRSARAVRLRRAGTDRRLFLSGGQIDGGANINLVGVRDIAAYPRAEALPDRSSAYLSTTWCRAYPFHAGTLAARAGRPIGFVSAPNGSARRGTVGPTAIRSSPRCLFRFDPDGGAVRAVASSDRGPGARATAGLPTTLPTGRARPPTPDTDTLRTLRTDVARTIADTYPAFAAMAGIGSPSAWDCSAGLFSCASAALDYPAPSSACSHLPLRASPNGGCLGHAPVGAGRVGCGTAVSRRRLSAAHRGYRHRPFARVCSRHFRGSALVGPHLGGSRCCSSRRALRLTRTRR